MKDKKECNLLMQNDFGEVELTEKLRAAMAQIAAAAWTLQVTPSEMMEILEDAPTSCPHCEAETERDYSDYVDYCRMNGITPYGKTTWTEKNRNGDLH